MFRCVAFVVAVMAIGGIGKAEPPKVADKNTRWAVVKFEKVTFVTEDKKDGKGQVEAGYEVEVVIPPGPGGQNDIKTKFSLKPDDKWVNTKGPGDSGPKITTVDGKFLYREQEKKKGSFKLWCLVEEKDGKAIIKQVRDPRSTLDW